MLFVLVVPSAPSGLTVDIRTDDMLTVTWTAPESEMFTGYKVTISEGDNVKSVSPAKSATSVEIIELTPGTEYSIKLVTVNNQDESSELSETAFTCELLLYKPSVDLILYNRTLTTVLKKSSV